MNRPKCETCAYWIDTLGAVGQCRKKGPAIVALEMFEDKDDAKLPPIQRAENFAINATHWPVTEAGEWCGDHQDFPEYLETLKKRKGSAPSGKRSAT